MYQHFDKYVKEIFEDRGYYIFFVTFWHIEIIFVYARCIEKKIY